MILLVAPLFNPRVDFKVLVAMALFVKVVVSNKF